MQKSLQAVQTFEANIMKEDNAILKQQKEKLSQQTSNKKIVKISKPVVRNHKLKNFFNKLSKTQTKLKAKANKSLTHNPALDKALKDKLTKTGSKKLIQKAHKEAVKAQMKDIKNISK